MNKNLSNRHYFRQAPTIVNGKYSLKKSESDLVFALLTEIQKEDEDFKDYTFTLSQLEIKLGMEINPGQLRVAAKGLMSKILEVENSEEDWKLLSWFSYFEYKKGVITCRFDKAMKPYLLELKQFVNADIRHLAQIKSEYSRRIYLMLKERFKFGERKFEIEDLMERLEVKKSYREYGKFKQKVLTPAVQDINKYTDLEVKNIGTAKEPIYFEEHKPSRKVEAVTFYFKSNMADLKQFIEWIRELYPNQPLYPAKDGRMLKCTSKGLLYYVDDVNDHPTLDKETAQKAWEWLHENRERLECFKPNLLDFEGADQ